MEISQLALAKLYFFACILGAMLGVCYDLLRISRIFFGVRYSRRASKRLQELHLPLLKPREIRKKSKFLGTLIFFEDFLFGLFTGVCAILLFYAFNNGKFRFPAIVCTFGGFFLYRASLGRIVMLFSELIAFAIETSIRYILFFLLFPFRWIKKKIISAFKHAFAYIQKKSRKKQRQKQTKQVQHFAQGNACGLIPKRGNSQGILKRGHRYGTAKKQEAVQLEHADAHIRRRHRSRVSDRVCK